MTESKAPTPRRSQTYRSRLHSSGEVGGPRGSRGERRPAWVRIAALSALALLFACSAYAFYRYRAVQENLAPPKVERRQIAAALDPSTNKSADAFTYILLLGNDTRAAGKWARSDTILLARLSNKDKSVLLLSIPRDTYTKVRGHGWTKINHASAYGGAALEIETVKAFTGLPVNHYIQIDFGGFGRAVDALGGVDMYVDRRIATTRGWLGPGIVHLDGASALSAVRNRKYVDGDFSRARNQQRFLSAVFKKLAAERNPALIARIVSLVSGEVETDMSMGQMLDFFKAYQASGSGKIPAYTVPGRPSSLNGISYVMTDDAKAQKLFSAILRGETPPTTK